ncbi:DUF488 domain-containing protein [Lentibacillus sp. L22]|uniref:DUF488 domain-containing protein n=1 Tax=Lentibacillus TaxID=175304 RepID=UPI0022B11948|nr:DUF488 domain-containing protein [Lentibacillus daqui]
MAIAIKRIYEEAEQDDGIRILVDRVWPRGMSKEKAKLDYWIKDVGPSNELRKWFGHDPGKYPAFKQKYKDELAEGSQHEELEKLKKITKENNGHVTLLFSAKDETHNQANVLKEILEQQ